ncbi:MAG: M48 family metalloprotease [Gammaproteobacteria bacterium]
MIHNDKLRCIDAKPWRSGVTACLIVALCGCAGPDVPALTASEPGFQQSPEEKKLVARAAAIDRDLDEKGMLLDDSAMRAYVSRIGHALVPPSAAGQVSFNFHILRSPVVNAFALPNGSIYLTVGLLDRLENEAELAQVLAHEIAHVVLRHGLKVSESNRSSIVAAHIADLFLFGTSLAYLPYLASVASYSREQEEEADRFGLAAVAANGYSPQAALQLFDSMKVVKKGESLEGSWYSSHPSNPERRDALQDMLRTGKVTQHLPARAVADYRAMRAPIATENIRLKLHARQYELALDAANRNQADAPQSALMRFYTGEAYRRMAEDPAGAAREHAWIYGKTYNDKLTAEFEQKRREFFDAAEAAYRHALDLEKSMPAAQRGLGLVQLGRGEYAAAREKLAAYLAHNPAAQDRDYIANLLKGIEQ